MIVYTVTALALFCSGWSLLEIVRTPDEQVRLMEKWWWQLAVFALPFIGPAMWVIAGKPSRHELRAARISGLLQTPALRYDSTRFRAPDDDDAWLATLAGKHVARPAEGDLA